MFINRFSLEIPPQNQILDNPLHPAPEIKDILSSGADWYYRINRKIPDIVLYNNLQPK